MPVPRTFAEAVLAAVRALPRGRVATYGDVADTVGRPGAARAVARVLCASERGDVPYHRVVSAGGLVRGPGAAERARRLRAEGVSVSAGRVRDFTGRRWP